MVRRGAVTCWPATSQYGSTALVVAASECHRDTVEVLLDRGADPNAKNEVIEAAVWLLRDGAPGVTGGWRATVMAVMRRGVVPP